MYNYLKKCNKIVIISLSIAILCTFSLLIKKVPEYLNEESTPTLTEPEETSDENEVNIPLPEVPKETLKQLLEKHLEDHKQFVHDIPKDKDLQTSMPILDVKSNIKENGTIPEPVITKTSKETQNVLAEAPVSVLNDATATANVNEPVSVLNDATTATAKVNTPSSFVITDASTSETNTTSSISTPGSFVITGATQTDTTA